MNPLDFKIILLLLSVIIILIGWISKRVIAKMDDFINSTNKIHEDFKVQINQINIELALLTRK